MAAYYNEHDPFAAAWLRKLIEAGHLPAGDVDERDIQDVKPGDLDGYVQCHFFAGIGGWPLALRMAGWDDDRHCWTGSCPCQPFSSAGKRRGTADARHLWPDFLRLIYQRRPATIFGEQVASPDGRIWIAGVRADLEALDHAVGIADLAAASVEAPQIRQRLYWVADYKGDRCGQGSEIGRGSDCREHENSRSGSLHSRNAGRMANSEVCRHSQPEQRRVSGEETGGGSRMLGLDRHGPAGGMGNTDDSRSQGRRLHGSERANELLARPASYWSDFDIVHCRDGTARRIEPGTFPLAHGVPNRVGRIRGYGNAIVPQVAATFIKAYRETLGETVDECHC